MYSSQVIIESPTQATSEPDDLGHALKMGMSQVIENKSDRDEISTPMAPF